ncbi:MAG: hypothetical protein COB07_08405 [Sulfurovum sp.]|nr:MAG: hypothetical protein COB07_08405 [Sulfurovum sp.]
MVYTVKTSSKIDTVKDELETKAKEVGFGILHTYDFKQILQGKGFPIEKDITVFEVCNPEAAQQALTRLSSISVYLPCRISVYEEDGYATLATIGFEDMLGSVDVDEDFQAQMALIFEDLKRIMHSWDN